MTEWRRQCTTLLHAACALHLGSGMRENGIESCELGQSHSRDRTRDRIGKTRPEVDDDTRIELAWWFGDDVHLRSHRGLP